MQPLSLLAHVWYARTGDINDAIEIGVNHCLEPLRTQLLERRNIAEPGVVNDDIETPKRFSRRGEFYFADRQVDQNAGAIQLAARFANPGNVLRPGQYGKVRAIMRVQRNGLLIPQAAVNEQQGSHVVYVVGSDGRVAVRTVQVGERTGAMWIIQDGLKPGERVIVEGQQNLKPGMAVQAKPFKGNTE